MTLHTITCHCQIRMAWKVCRASRIVLHTFAELTVRQSRLRPKTTGFYEQNNSSTRASRILVSFLLRPLYYYDVKPRNATFYGGREPTSL